METLAEVLRELRDRFLRGSGERLDRIRAALARLELQRHDANALADLRREFHSLSGLGTTYGFPQVTALGMEGEARCEQRLNGTDPPDVADLLAWKSGCDRLRQEFAGAGVVEESGPRDVETRGPRDLDILLVDDDHAIHRQLARSANREGMALRSATTRAEALSELRQSMPDGLLVDVGLPDGSGFELVEWVRAMPGGAGLPILIVSGLGDFLDRVEAIRCGADGFFEKPVEWEAISRRLNHLFDRARTEPARILSVEDDPDQGAFLRAILESAGYEASTVSDPAEFERILISFRPDLVLMDILLPGVSGYDLARFLRQDERYATLPVLFLTTEQQLAVRIEAVKAGGDEHLVKPIAPGLLLAAVASRMERARFLKDLISRDGLTRLLTHTAFLEQARGVLSRHARRADCCCALVMLDLDHFKSVNDLYGHPIGDRVLSALATLLRTRLRQSDTIGRLGGEEFAVLLENLTEGDAVRLMERLLDEFAAMEHAAKGGGAFHVSFSAGIAMLDPGRMDLNAWVAAADEALYAAKRGGRRRVMAVAAPLPLEAASA